MDGRAAHPAQGRSMVARGRSVRAHLEKIPAFGLEPAALSCPEVSSRIGGNLSSTYGLHDAVSAAEKVRLSAIDLPVTQPTRALPLLPPRLSSFTAAQQILPEADVIPTRTHFAVEDSDYLPLLRRLEECGMLELSEESELYDIYPRYVVNGMFAVPKASSGKQRLIIDCRAGNAHMPAPESPALPDRAVFGELVLDPKVPWAVGATDLATYFYSLRVENWMVGLQGLPRVWVPDDAPLSGRHGWLFPALTVAAMGNAHSMVIAQAVHRTLWKLTPRLPSGAVDDKLGYPARPAMQEIGLKSLRRAIRCKPDDVSLSVYVDDSIQLGEEAQVTRAQSDFIKNVEDCGLRFAYPKWDRPSSGPINALGWTIDLTSGVVRPQIPKLQSLMFDTTEALRRKRLSRAVVRTLVGRWTDTFLLRRPLLPVFNSVYCEEGKRMVHAQLRAELQLALDIAPVIYRNVYRPFSDIIVAYDASTTGGAVVYTRADPSRVESLSKFEARNCLDKPQQDAMTKEQTAGLISSGFEDLSWKLAVRRDFRDVDEHINVLEAEMLCTALEWLSRTGCNFGQRHLLFGDNQAVVYGATKGRSSRRGLQHMLRRVAAYAIALDAHLYHGWVPTLLNPADADSRFFESPRSG